MFILNLTLEIKLGSPPFSLFSHSSLPSLFFISLSVRSPHDILFGVNRYSIFLFFFSFWGRKNSFLPFSFRETGDGEGERERTIYVGIFAMNLIFLIKFSHNSPPRVFCALLDLRIDSGRGRDGRGSGRKGSKHTHLR